MNGCKFKVGDRVRVVKDGETANIKSGEIYTVIKVTEHEVKKACYGVYINASSRYFYEDRFEPENEYMTIEKQLKKANELIGKDVITLDTKRRYTVSHAGIMTPKDPNLSKVSDNVIKEAKKSGYCVYVGNTIYSTHIENVYVPVPDPEAKVKLNDTYEAIISKDTIKVGCQTFPISILADLNDAYASL